MASTPWPMIRQSQWAQIGATFKYAYLEDPDFNAGDMHESIIEIESAVAQTLQLVIQQAHIPKARKLIGQPHGSQGSKQDLRSDHAPLLAPGVLFER
jgi:hypothetical protein